MNRLLRIKPLWWGLFLTGLFLISLSFAYKYARVEMDRVKRSAASRDEIRALQSLNQEKLQALSERIEGQISEPQDLLSRWSEKGMLSFTPAEPKELPGGYRLHRVNVSMENFPPADLPSLIHTLENATPAWRIQRVDLLSAEGRLKGELLMDALDKVPPEL